MEPLRSPGTVIEGAVPAARRPYDVCWQNAAPGIERGDVAGGNSSHNSASDMASDRRTRAAAKGLDPDEDIGKKQMRLEAVLLVAKTPLNTRKLAQLAHLADGTEARTLVRRLNKLYDEMGRAVRIEQLAGGYRLMTRSVYAPWLTRLGHLPEAIRLSSPMMETLAVVAYRGPVSRADIESVRGVACGELLRQLMDRELIRIAGRSEELGRPYLYDITKHFMKLFGLPNRDALPRINWEPLQESPVHTPSHPA